MTTETKLENVRALNSKKISCDIVLREIILLLFVMCLVGAVHAQETNPLLSKEELTDIASQMETNERNLVNIEVDSEVWMEERLSKSKQWQRTPIYVSSTAILNRLPTSTAILNGLPNSKARVDVHKEVEKWQEGDRPYADISYSVGFDGQYGKTIYHYSRSNEEKHVMNKGEITPGVPNRLRSGSLRAFTGQAFSMHFCLNPEGYTFSQLFKWATDPNTKADSSFIFSRDLFYGVECIKIGPKKDAGESWWLDPNRDYALIGHKFTGYYEKGEKRIVSFARVTNLEKVAKGIWWPKEVLVEADPDKPGQPYKRMIYKAIDVRVNRPDFNEEVYNITFPNGCVVDDKVSGKKYRIGEDLNDPKNQ